MLPPFEIHAPKTAADAATARRDLGEEAAVYAGGTELVLVMKEGLGAWRHLIDIKGIAELHELGVADGAPDTLRIGAAVSHRTLVRSALVRARWPLLAETEAQVANPRVRAVGTLGGNLAFAEPRSDPAATLLVHEARVTLASPSARRTLPLSEFLRGSYETALAPDEVLTGIEVPAAPAGAHGAYLKYGLHERPTVGVAALVVPARDGTVAQARVAVGCVAAVPVRLGALERALRGAALATLAAGTGPARGAGEGLDAVSDLHGSAEYKQHLVGVFAARALAEAARRATRAA
jgi:carbon-monoxide dehydrogenase medium subunit